MSKPSTAGISDPTSSAAESDQAAVTKFERNKDGRPRVESRFLDDATRCFQGLIAKLPQTSKQNITFYAMNVFAESEPRAVATARAYLTFQTKGTRKVQFQYLDFILTKKETFHAA